MQHERLDSWDDPFHVSAFRQGDSRRKMTIMKTGSGYEQKEECLAKRKKHAHSVYEQIWRAMVLVIVIVFALGGTAVTIYNLCGQKHHGAGGGAEALRAGQCRYHHQPSDCYGPADAQYAFDQSDCCPEHLYGQSGMKFRHLQIRSDRRQRAELQSDLQFHLCHRQ